MAAVHGWDADTVVDEGLGGVADPDVLSACRREDRTLVTLDRNVAAPADLDERDPGVIVLRPRTQSVREIAELFHRALTQLPSEDLRGRIAIVEPGRVRWGPS